MGIKDQLVEQKITKRITVAGNSTGEAVISIPKSAVTFLKGYGYTWFSDHVYQITTGKHVFPSRTDQEGSTSQPVIYSTPFSINTGDSLRLKIINNSTSSKSYDVVFLILTSELIQISSEGEDLLFNTGINITKNFIKESEITVSGSSSTWGYYSDMFDEDTTTGFNIGTSDTNLIITFDMGEIKTIKSIIWASKVICITSQVNVGAILYISDNGSDWTELYNASRINVGTTSFSYQGINLSGRYLKIDNYLVWDNNTTLELQAWG